MIINSPNDIEKLIENNEVEIKKAFDSFPNDALQTYSAFANTNGGYIILGLTENIDNEFILSGVNNSIKIIKELFDLLNNKSKVSKNLLSESDVKEYEIESSKIIIIKVPAAKYSDKPIYLNNNRYRAYYRQNSSDYKCSEEMVNSMIRDASPESFDSTILESYDFDDLDIETIKKYRNRFAQLKLEHPYNNDNDLDFLIKIGAMCQWKSH